MGNEIDLLAKYPRTKRDLAQRLESKTEEVRLVARKFDKDFFDGERKFGYGGFSYNPRYWSEVVKDFSNYYNLNDESKILDVGCAKGFMLYDFYKLNPQLDLHGVDVSKYAIDNSVSEIKNKLQVANATKLPYEDNFFDLVISVVSLIPLLTFSYSSSISFLITFISLSFKFNNEEKKTLENNGSTLCSII